MKKFFNTISILVLLLVSMVAVSAPVLGVVSKDMIKSIEINGREVFSPKIDSLDFRRGEDLDINVQLSNTGTSAAAAVTEVDLMLAAELHYEWNDLPGTRVRDATALFDLSAGQTRFKDLRIEIPHDIKARTAQLWIYISSPNSGRDFIPITLKLEGQKHSLEIERVLFTPHDRVQAGSLLYGKVRVENYGNRDEDDILVGARISELPGASDTDIIDRIEGGDDSDRGRAVTSEELFLQIPPCAEPGTYTVEVDVLYDNDRRHIRDSFDIEVVSSEVDLCSSGSGTQTQSEGQVVVATTTPNVEMGGSVTYPMTILNPGRNSAVYMVEVSGADDWADVSVEPSNLVALNAGELKALRITADVDSDATEGEKFMVLTVKTQSGQVVEQHTLKANVEESENDSSWSSDSLMTFIKVAFFVLVVLVILIALIIAFNKLRSDDFDDEDLDEEDEKTYY